MADDGSFYILDGVNSRMQHFAPDGHFLESLDLREIVVGALDIRLLNGGIYLLDHAAMPPRVVKLNGRGKVVASYPIPPELDEALSGMAAGRDGQMYLVKGVSSQYPLADVSGVVPPSKRGKMPGRTSLRSDNFYATKGADWVSNFNKGSVEVLRRDLSVQSSISIAVDNMLGSVALLDVDNDGNFYVAVEELLYVETINVEKTVRKYDKNGTLLGIARVPLERIFAMPAREVAVDASGNVFALVPAQQQVEVRKLAFTQDYKSPLSQSGGKSHLAVARMADFIGQAFHPGVAEVHPNFACRSWADIYNTAQGYRNNSHYLSYTNISGYCLGREQPRYLTNPGTYWSVPYKCCGFNTVSEYNSGMSPGTAQAGDINTTCDYPGRTCARGVDCSGFVSRCWDLNDHYGTCNIEQVSTKLNSLSDLNHGDILRKCNVHVVLFHLFSRQSGQEGVMCWESTKTNNYDRVVYQFRPWTQLSGYEPRQYNNICS